MKSYTCRKCGQIKPDTEFYRHKRMLSGYLSYCKECVKERVREHRKANLDKVREYDRKRGLFPHRKAKVVANAHKYLGKKAQYMDAYFSKNPNKRAAHSALQCALRAGRLTKPNTCERCSKEHPRIHGHHEDYSKPLTVIWLCPNCHGERHREINEMMRCTAAE